jgi:hypothetical protein
MCYTPGNWLYTGTNELKSFALLLGAKKLSSVSLLMVILYYGYYVNFSRAPDTNKLVWALFSIPLL